MKIRKKLFVKYVIFLFIILIILGCAIAILILDNYNKKSVEEIYGTENRTNLNVPLGKYMEKDLPFNYYGDLSEKLIEDIFLDKEGIIYAFEWDTVIDGNSQTINGLSCLKLSWNDGSQYYIDLNLDRDFTLNTKNVTSIFYTYENEEKTFVFSGGGVTIFDLNGKIISEFSIEIGGIVTSCYSLGEELYIIKKYGEDSYILKFNWKNRTFISKIKKKNMALEKIIDERLYGFDEKYVYELDMNGKEIRKILKPNILEPNMQIVLNREAGVEDEEITYIMFTKELVTAFGGEIYYVNKDGVYYVEDKGETFKLLMSSEDSKFIEGEFYLNDIIIKNQEEIYLLATPGDGDTSNLAVYNLIK